MNRLLVIAALIGALGVVAGTFGAHWLPNHLAARETVAERVLELRAVFETGARYHMYHALALLVLAVWPLGGTSTNVAAWLFGVGILIFSGSLYTLAITDIRQLGMITPLGGVCFIAGWIALAIAAVQKT
jgi:uncharacterized membrane protein YgdD (TMEM256/DUF423 family)